MNGLGYPLHQGYGMTETGIVSVELSNRANKRNLLSVGKPFKNIKWRINEDQILELNSPMLARKIINVDNTIEFNDNRWFVTNDMFINKHGRLLMIGRSDDIIISSEGIKINPEEIENIFQSNINLQCAAIPYRLPSGHDKIILIIESPVTIDKLSHSVFKVINDLPINQRPREVYVTNKLPLTNLGKVKHVILKEMFINSPELFNKVKNDINSDHIKQQYSNELIQMLNIVKKCYAEVLNLNIKQIDDHTDFTLDLGGTSLDYYSLLNKVSIVTGKQINLVNNKVLTTPIDFALLLIKTQ
jgi:long-subunit acyl-CoA synthetase (AMP-forming)/acyl carrier protein